MSGPTVSASVRARLARRWSSPPPEACTFPASTSNPAPTTMSIRRSAVHVGKSFPAAPSPFGASSCSAHPGTWTASGASTASTRCRSQRASGSRSRRTREYAVPDRDSPIEQRANGRCSTSPRTQGPWETDPRRARRVPQEASNAMVELPPVEGRRRVSPPRSSRTGLWTASCSDCSLTSRGSGAVWTFICSGPPTSLTVTGLSTGRSYSRRSFPGRKSTVRFAPIR